MTKQAIISQYMQDIGRKGGLKGGKAKGNSSKVAKAAINKRWKIVKIELGKAKASKFSPAINEREELIGVITRGNGERGALVQNEKGSFAMVVGNVETILSKAEVLKHL